MALLNLAASATPDAPVEIVVDKRDPFPVLYSKLNFTLLAIIIALIVVIVGTYVRSRPPGAIRCCLPCAHHPPP